MTVTMLSRPRASALLTVVSLVSLTLASTASADEKHPRVAQTKVAQSKKGDRNRPPPAPPLPPPAPAAAPAPSPAAAPATPPADPNAPLPPPNAAPAAAPLAPPAAPAQHSSLGTVRVDPNLKVVQVDGAFRRAQDGAVTVSCGPHRIKAGMSERTIDVPCGGAVSF